MIPRIVQLPLGDDPPTARLYYGQNVVDSLRELPDGSVHVVCTSPPYWGLRDYGVPPQDWPEVTFSPMSGLPEVVTEAQKVALGLENDPMAYVAHLVAVFREIRRVLRDDGTAWLNLGDSYISRSGFLQPLRGKSRRFEDINAEGDNTTAANLDHKHEIRDIPHKSLALIPHRVAMALQGDGWVVRNDIVWAKPACMPEPVKDRCTRNHEYVFMLAKSRFYYYDRHAVLEPFADGRMGRDGAMKDRERNVGGRTDGYTKPNDIDPSAHGGRNRRTVWNIATRPYPGAHFAVWPPELVGVMIEAGTSEHGVCPTCGAPWRREVEKVVPVDPGRGADSKSVSQKDKMLGRSHDAHRMLGSEYQDQLDSNPPKTVRWGATCDCPGGSLSRPVVLDPFSGSATTGMVALKLGRDYIGIDLQDDYLKLAEARLLGLKAPQPVDEEEEGDIFDFFGVEDG